MALVKLAKINNNSFWAVWKIEESLSMLIELLRPSYTDLQYLENTVHHPKKKLEWLAGRLSLQALLRHLDISQWHIIKDIHGKPHLAKQNIHISLANSFPYAAAIVHTAKSVGIDMEHPSEKMIRVSHKFLNSEELRQAGTDIDLLCAFWCTKESIYKLYGRKMLSFKEHIFIQSFDRHTNLIKARVISPFHKAHHQLLLEHLNNFHIVYSL